MRIYELRTKYGIKEPFSILSNLVFLVPIYYTLEVGNYVHGLVIFLVMTSSMAYHYVKPEGPLWWHNTHHLTEPERKYLWIESAMMIILFFMNFIMFHQAGFPVEFYFALAISAIGAIFFLLPSEKEYDLFQGTWHILFALITLLAV